MSSFQQFKKNISSSKSNKSNSRVSYQSFVNELPQLQNVSFSTSEIAFAYNQQQQLLINQQLKVVNRTGTKIYYKIRSSNPEFYDIRPNQDILENNTAVNVIFRMKKNHILAKKDDRNGLPYATVAAATSKDVFQFKWAEITEENIRAHQIPLTTNQQLLPVKVIEPKSKTNIKNLQIKVGNSLMNSQNKLQNKSNLKGNNFKNEVVNSVSIMSDEQLMGANHSTLLTIPIIAGVAILSFLIGYITA